MSNLLFIPTVINLGGATIAFLDVVALILIAVALIEGLIKGFTKQILSVLGFFVALILAYTFSGKVTTFIIENVPGITNTIQGAVEKAIGVTTESITSEEALRTALANSSIPSFIHEPIIKLIVESNFTATLVPTITGWILNIATFIILTLLFLVVFAIVKKVANKIVSIPLIKTADKILGVTFSLLKFTLIYMLVLMLASTFLPLNGYLNPVGINCYANSALEFITNSAIIEKLIVKLI
ncbi:MAG: CvpA family protein [Clostridia bacterium]|nr:CvpA family protein [Clostridia bacterium]